MNKKEKDQMLEIFERLTRLETIIDLKFKDLSSDLKEMSTHIHKLNEEFGGIDSKIQNLKLEQKELKRKYNTQLRAWKLIAGIASPTISAFLTWFLLNVLIPLL